jgi:hypothetical protein
MPVTTGRILDLLAEAATRYKREGRRGIDWTFDHTTDEERLAFDLFLVKMKDLLAYEPGTCEHRFRTRAIAMAENRSAASVLED